MDKFTNTMAVEWFKALSTVFQEKKELLTELDRQIGDADHGTNMARGFVAVASKVEAMTGQEDIGAIFKTAAMTLISTVGGASGPLYGTFFLQASMPANGKTDLDVSELAAVLKAGLNGVMARGKAALGEKTMIDAITPAVEALENSSDKSLSEALKSASEAARKGAESTSSLLATKGRASYLGERSKGHEDPGAESAALMFEALYKVVSEDKE